MRRIGTRVIAITMAAAMMTSLTPQGAAFLQQEMVYAAEQVASEAFFTQTGSATSDKLDIQAEDWEDKKEVKITESVSDVKITENFLMTADVTIDAEGYQSLQTEGSYLKIQGVVKVGDDWTWTDSQDIKELKADSFKKDGDNYKTSISIKFSDKTAADLKGVYMEAVGKGYKGTYSVSNLKLTEVKIVADTEEKEVFKSEKTGTSAFDFSALEKEDWDNLPTITVESSNDALAKVGTKAVYRGKVTIDQTAYDSLAGENSYIKLQTVMKLGDDWAWTQGTSFPCLTKDSFTKNDDGTYSADFEDKYPDIAGGGMHELIVRAVGLGAKGNITISNITISDVVEKEEVLPAKDPSIVDDFESSEIGAAADWANEEGWKYDNTVTPAVAEINNSKALKLNLDYSKNSGESWSEAKIHKTFKDGLDVSAYNQISYDLIYPAAFDGVFKAKVFAKEVSSGTTIIEKDVSSFDITDLGNGMKKAVVTVKFTPNTAKITDLTLGTVGVSTAFKGDVYIDNITLSQYDPTADFVDITSKADTEHASQVDITGMATSVSLADKDATASAKALYSYLKNLDTKDQVLFGHQNDTHKSVNTNGSGSDTKDMTGSISGVVGIDSLALTGTELGLSDTTAAVKKAVEIGKDAAKEGGILTLSAHMPNMSNSKIVLKKGLPSIGDVVTDQDITVTAKVTLSDSAEILDGNANDDGGYNAIQLAGVVKVGDGWTYTKSNDYPFLKADNFKDGTTEVQFSIPAAAGKLQEIMFEYNAPKGYTGTITVSDVKVNGTSQTLWSSDGDAKIVFDASKDAAWADVTYASNDSAVTADKYDFSACDFAESKDLTNMKNNGAKEVLPGGKYNAQFTAYLDIIAAYAKGLGDIPVLFRPFHEGDGGWFWWGNATTDDETFKALYRYTEDYLTSQGVHNLIYVYSPCGPANEATFENRYPGDDYVDVLSFDYYDDYGVSDSYSDSYFTNMEKGCKVIYDLAQKKGKVAAIAEAGARIAKKDGSDQEGIRVKDNPIKDQNWYKKINDVAAKTGMSYFLLWANFSDTNFYIPYKYNDTKGQELINEFIDFYNEDSSVFADGTNFYGKADKTEVSNTNKGTDVSGYVNNLASRDVVMANDTLSASVKNAGDKKVQFVVTNGDKSVTLDAADADKDGIYDAVFTEDALKTLGKTDQAKVSLKVGDESLVTLSYVSLGKNKPSLSTDTIEDFDLYFNDDDYLAGNYSANSGAGCSSSLTLNQTYAQSGECAGAFNYSLTGAGGYSGQYKSEEYDFSAYNALRFWAKPDGKGQKLIIQLTSGESSEEFEVDLTKFAKETKSGVVTIPFSAFKGKNGGTFDASKITKFAIYCNRQGGSSALSSTIYFDNIKAVRATQAQLDAAKTDGFSVVYDATESKPTTPTTPSNKVTDKNRTATIAATAAKATIKISPINKKVDTNATLTGTMVSKIKKTAGTSNVTITETAVDKNGKTAYQVNVNAKDLKPGAKLTYFRYDTKKKCYNLSKAKTVTVAKDGTVKLKVTANNIYYLKNATDAKKINSSIYARAKLSKSSVTLKKGKTTTAALSSQLAKSNIAKITYSSSKSSVASVNSKGKITAKKKGTATITVKVTFVNKATKTLKMKVTVK